MSCKEFEDMVSEASLNTSGQGMIISYSISASFHRHLGFQGSFEGTLLLRVIRRLSDYVSIGML
jgi:hypothetical protein